MTGHGVRRWLRPAVVAAAILVAAAVPFPPGPDPRGLDALLHLLAHAALAATLADALDPDGTNGWRPLALAAVVAALYGAGIEVLQASLPTRSTAATDALAAAVGSGLGALAWRRRRSR
ncbi:MAG: VanZ family protein [Halobacteriales archaeon]